MRKYIMKRILWLIPIVLGVSILVFTLMYVAPGDPAVIIMGPTATEKEYDILREQLGLNRGYFVRLGEFLYNSFIKFDFGTSYLTKGAIVPEILARFPRTVLLAALCMMASIIIGVPLGIIAALKQNSIGDRLCMVFAFIGVSMPNFWLALLLILLFSVKLNILPPMGFGGLQYYILPMMAASMGGIAAQARQSRSAMLEVIRSDYVTTARSKGLSSIGVILRQELPNTLIPVITIAGNRFGGMLGGVVVLEKIFGIPGIGAYLVDGVFNRDYPVVQACVIFLAVAFTLIMLCVDILFALVDPRIKAQYSK